MITKTELENKGNLFPDGVVHFIQEGNSFRFTTENNVILAITVLHDKIFRFRYATDRIFESDFSYSIDPSSRFEVEKLEISDTPKKFIISTAYLNCEVSKADLHVCIKDLNGKTLLEDELGFHWEENYEFGGNIVKMSKKSSDRECFYGLGDKATHLNLMGKRFHNWNTDQYAFEKDQDPLYKTVPFYISLKRKKACGIFFDNSFKTHFDFCQERKKVTSFWSDGGEMNYYFLYGPSIRDVVVNYTNLTGKPELPPLWALGYHQCKWSYYPESKVKEIAGKFRELNIPCDAIYLDIDYMDGFRCFTWNKEYFPELKRMVSELSDSGFKTVVMIDPGIKIDPGYFVYQEAIENDYFCKRADGPYIKGKVWPGDCYFPDFTNPRVRQWWAGLYKELIADIGVNGIWNDMNEPAVMEVPSKTFPLDVRHDYDGNPCSHRKSHNIYGMQMARATYEGLKNFLHPKRPFVITRAAFSGTQRFSSCWTGDNVATWEHLWIANVQIQRLCISGMSFAGTDIGGFAEQPTGELYARWIQLAMFHPFFRTHSSGQHGEQEPWTFGVEITDIVRKSIELRYQLLPYLYTSFWKYVQHGEPMLKSLVYFDQEDEETYFRTDEFIFGDQILVCPILEPKSKGRKMYLPKGRWYSLWNSEEVLDGGKEIWAVSSLETIPVFVKEGACIPKYPVQQFVGEKKISEVYLEVYFKEGEETSTLYEDSGDGYDYLHDEYRIHTFILTGSQNNLTLKHHQEGEMVAAYENISIKIIGLPFIPEKVFVDSAEIDFQGSLQDGNLRVPKDFKELKLIAG